MKLSNYCMEFNTGRVRLPDFEFSEFYAVIGFVVFLTLSCVAAFGFDVGESLPKWVRFASILATAGIGSYVLGKTGNVLLLAFWLLSALALIGGIGLLIWHYA